MNSINISMNCRYDFSATDSRGGGGGGGARLGRLLLALPAFIAFSATASRICSASRRASRASSARFWRMLERGSKLDRDEKPGLDSRRTFFCELFPDGGLPGPRPRIRSVMRGAEFSLHANLRILELLRKGFDSGDSAWSSALQGCLG
jgi:hypothetical protein